VATWLEGVRSSFVGPIAAPWTAHADDKAIQRRLDDLDTDDAENDIMIQQLYDDIREWNEFVVHSREDVAPFICRSSDVFGRCPYIRCEATEA